MSACRTALRRCLGAAFFVALVIGFLPAAVSAAPSTGSSPATVHVAADEPSDIDTDGDGLPDFIDNCPTVYGPVQFGGCPTLEGPDSDGDGVPDVLDRCPDTPAGAMFVNGIGCAPFQYDGDGDGVSDQDDRCLSTPPGEVVDSAGCSVVVPDPDADGDGVADASDNCPGTPPGAVVDSTGCTSGQSDSDGDGVSDADDQCPADTGTPATSGCPDSDGDGIYDNSDRCAFEAGPAATGGCPDSDGDGIQDQYDLCPGTVTGAAIDADGCSSDQRDDDYDGVANGDDRCPTVAGPASNGGCPLTTTVTAKPVTFQDRCGTKHDTFTVPSTGKAKYYLGTKRVYAGTYAGRGTVTVTARAKGGYTLTGTTSWSTTFSTKACRAGTVQVTSSKPAQVRVSNGEHAAMVITVGGVTKKVAADATVSFAVSPGRRPWTASWSADLAPTSGTVVVRGSGAS